LDGITNGTAAASKAVILDASKNITGIAALTASTFKGDGSGLTGISSDNVDVTDKDDDVNYQIVGVAAAGDSVALITDDDNAFTFNPSTAVTALPGALKLADGSTFGPSSVSDLITMTAAGDLTFKDGAYDFNIASHDGTNGLMLAGTLVAATATELDYTNVAAIGTAEASKAMVVDASKDIGGINQLSASIISGNLGYFNDLTVSATSITIGTVTIDETEAGWIDTSGSSLAEGTAAASKAIILDSNKDVSSIGELTATALTGSNVKFGTTGGWGKTQLAGGLQYTGYILKTGNFTVGSTLPYTHYLMSSSTDITATLPQISSSPELEGASVWFKRLVGFSAVVKCMLSASGGDTIDGDNDLHLIASGSAVRLFATGSTWHIF